MDDLDVGHEETVKSSKDRRKKSKFYLWLCYFLMKGTHQHMLHWTNDEETEFEIVYTDKKNKRKWTEKDISLFLDMDSKIPRDRDEKGDSKGRFRANMHKLANNKLANNRYLKDLGTKKHPSSTSKTFKKYRLKEMISKDVVESKIEAINSKAKKTVIEKSNQCREEIKAPSEKSVKSTAMDQNKRKRSENTCGSLKKLKKSLPTQISPLPDMRKEVFKSNPAETFVPKSSPDLQGETVYAEGNKRNDGLGAFEDGRYKFQFITIGNYPCYVQDTVGNNGLDVCATDHSTNHSDEDNLFLYTEEIQGSNGLNICATNKFQLFSSNENIHDLNAIKVKEVEFGSEFPQENTNQSVSDVYVTVNPEMKEMFEFRSETDTQILNPDKFLNLDALQLNKMEYRSDLCQENKILQNALQLNVIPVNEMDYISDMSEENSENQSVFDLDAIPVNEMEYRSELSELNNVNLLDFDNLCGWLQMDDGNCDDNCK